MSEAALANLALVLRVLILGGILICLPRITRRDLVFGTYVGEANADRDAAHGLVSSWSRGCLLMMGLALFVGLGISFAGRPIVGNFTGTAVFLAGVLVVYVRLHARACDLAPGSVARQARQAVASVDVSPPGSVRLAGTVLVLCLVTSLAVFAYVVANYDAQTAMRSPAVVVFVAGLNLILSPLLAVLALLSARAKRSLRGGSGGNSGPAQEAFRSTASRLLSCLALLMCAFLAFLSLQILRPVGGTESVLTVVAAAAVVVLFALGGLAAVARKYGQGGALLEQASVDAPLTDGLADNRRWVWGLFYVNSQDPAIMVEKRFGIGYTFNYGNPVAWWFTAGFLAALLSLTGITLYWSLGPGG